MNKIGQAEIINFLERCDKPMTRKQIAEAMNEDAIKVSHILKNLVRWAEVQFLELSGEEIKEVAGYYPGRRTRVYFIEGKVKIKNWNIKS